MTKYKTTNHGWLKAGIIISVNSGHKISLIDGSILGVSKEKFNQWIADGWVQKLQVPEFTEDEMAEFAEGWKNANADISVYDYLEKFKEK